MESHQCHTVWPKTGAELIVLGIFDFAYIIYFCRITSRVGDKIQKSSKTIITLLTYILMIEFVLKIALLFIYNINDNDNKKKALFSLTNCAIGLITRILILIVYIFLFQLKQIEIALDLNANTPQIIINKIKTMQKRIKITTIVVMVIDIFLISLDTAVHIVKSFNN